MTTNNIDKLTQHVWQAAEKKQACRLHVAGESGPRVVHPYGVCLTQRDLISLVCWQAEGFSTSNKNLGYRLFILTHIESIEILASHFHKRDDFNPADGQYKDWVFHI
jgi:predicted DNA-binding transcriptional regulator YafY